MTLTTPPKGTRPSPRVRPLEVGTRLWRLHSDGFAPNAFNPTIPARFAGGRFDNTDGSFAYLYAGSDTIAAVAETLLRDRPPRGPYQIPRKVLQGRSLSRLVLAVPLEVVVLHGGGLSAIRQKAELTSSGPEHYDTTRAWAVALRADAPSAHGFKWRARYDNDRFAFVFFGDRCSSADFVVEETHSLADAQGLSLVKRALAAHDATVA